MKKNHPLIFTSHNSHHNIHFLTLFLTVHVSKNIDLYKRFYFCTLHFHPFILLCTQVNDIFCYLSRYLHSIQPLKYQKYGDEMHMTHFLVELFVVLVISTLLLPQCIQLTKSLVVSIVLSWQMVINWSSFNIRK